jgi:hypothetical protein
MFVTFLIRYARLDATNMRLLCCFRSHAEEQSDEVQEQALSRESLPRAQPEALRPVNLPQTYPEHNFPEYGWTVITLQTNLLKSYQALLEAGKAFFALSEAEKEVFKTPQGSEEGWNLVEGEKEFITLRSLERTPQQMRDAAAI